MLRIIKRRVAPAEIAWESNLPPLLRRIMAASMKARPCVVPYLIAQVDHELDWFDQVLAERGDYLVGFEFGRADLTAASLLAATPALADHALNDPRRPVDVDPTGAVVT